MTCEPVTDEVVHHVALVGYPLRLGALASEHYEAVLREMALVASSQATSYSFPHRLSDLIEVLGRRHARSNEHEQQRDEALTRGETTIDLVLDVPASVAEVSRALDAMLDETEDHCRDGTMLTVAAAEDVVAFRRWYLRELSGQLDGHPANPWPAAG